jgi:hypothetical protein
MDLKPNNKTLIDGSPQASLIINPNLIGVHKQVKW